MTDAVFQERWIIGLIAVAVVVVVVVALALLIIVEARGILAAARRSLAAVEGTRDNVAPLWDLEASNAVAVDILAQGRRIEGTTRLLADAVDPQATPVAQER